MSRIHKVLFAVVLAGLTAGAAAETVYKWRDSSGQIHYTDLPPRQSDAKILGVYEQEAGTFEDGPSEEGDEGDESGSEGSGNAPSETDPTTSEPPVSADAMAAVEADVAKAKVEQCKAAQDRYKRYVESRRLFRETPDGKRQYLTDQELADARARARQAISDTCGSQSGTGG
jgi:Domain of unknown function (DUF4124)